MKRHLVALGLVTGLALALGSRQASGQTVSVSISYFYDELAPQGRWVVAADYGDVWLPSGVSAGWTPYVAGQWVYTDYGWTWVSDDPWGPIVYHYGTWAFVPQYGWVWVPGLVWAPAWVTWAYTDDFIGWAPVPVGFDIEASGYSGRAVVVSETSYVFIPAAQFSPGVQISTVRVSRARNSAILTRAQKVTQFSVSAGFVHNTGLPVAHVEKVSGKKVALVRAPAKLRPATIAAGTPGGGKAKVQVVAPTSERAAAIRSKSAAGGKEEPGGPRRPERPESRAPEQPERARSPEAIERRPSPRVQEEERPERGEEKKQPERTPEGKRTVPRPTPRPEGN